MAGAVSIRRAQRRDAAELAILVDLSSHGFAAQLWQDAVANGSAETALAHGRSELRRDDEPAGWTGASVAEVDDEVAGVVIGHVIDASFATAIAPKKSFEPILQLQRQVIGNWFIDSVGVYGHHRGRGIGRQLVDHELSRANGRPVSLITESDNVVALNLYKSTGFAEMARLASVQPDQDSKTHDWVLLTRSAT